MKEYKFWLDRGECLDESDFNNPQHIVTTSGIEVACEEAMSHFDRSYDDTATLYVNWIDRCSQRRWAVVNMVRQSWRVGGLKHLSYAEIMKVANDE